ncbi:hypothetical protein Cantr_02646 [Candida viswanathii]|uniref:Uncharacterized protein n=1 Tax=Candida viswanathii TaxID=5486 RepID=A0A367YMW1_9ASCO|nr:hypothetical protein Cantr_02646 [Candida viswanathii]
MIPTTTSDAPIHALGITEQSADDGIVISKQLPRLSPEAKAWIREESEAVIASVRDNVEVHFPVSSEFHPIIQDFLKLTEIENLLVLAHPVYLALLRFPLSDPEFSSNVFDPEYLAKNFNQQKFDKYMSRKEKNDGSSMIFIVDKYSFGAPKTTNVPPLSEQLFDESICAEPRLMKFFFDRAMPDDLRAKDIKYELTRRETTEFIKATQRFHQLCKHDVRSKNQTCDEEEGEEDEKEEEATTLELNPLILDWDDSDILNVDGDTSLSYCRRLPQLMFLSS